jgi:hypothetical protein
VRSRSKQAPLPAWYRCAESFWMAARDERRRAVWFCWRENGSWWFWYYYMGTLPTEGFLADAVESYRNDPNWVTSDTREGLLDAR